MAEPPFDPTDVDRLTPALQRLLGTAVLLTRESDETEDIQVNFSTLLLAFAVADDPISQWFQRYLRSVGIAAERLLDYKSIRLGPLDEMLRDTPPEKFLSTIREVSYSTSQVLGQADLLAQRLAPQSESMAQQSVQYESGPPRLDVYHVMGAYVYYPFGHEEQLAGWGLDRVHWAHAFLEALFQLYPFDEAQIDAWREIHSEAFGSPPQLSLDGSPEASAVPPEALPEVPPPAGLAERLAGYDGDRASGERADDLLEITPDVNALAALIAAKSTLPSLAIGIFGDWGSGKTFFMRSLRQRVDKLSAAARGLAVDGRKESPAERPQKEITFYKRIVQIEFNAWHYVEGNLWASLVEHIFSNLRLAQDDKWLPSGASPEALQEHLLGKFELAQRDAARASEEAAQARAKLTEAQEQLAEIQRERARRQQELADLSPQEVLAAADWSPVKAALDPALQALGLPEVAGQVDQVLAAIAEAKAVLRKSGTVLAPLRSAEDRKRRLWLLVAALVAAPLVGALAALIGLAIGWLRGQPDVGALVARFAGLASGAATLLGTGAAWLRKQTQWSAEQLARIEEADKRLEALQREKLSEYDARIAQLQVQAAALNADYTIAAQKAEAEQQRVDEIQEQLEQATPARLLARFIEDRTDSDDYRKHLGVLALVRRDFEALSDYIKGQNALLDEFEDLQAELKNARLRINRIVLYIDDLDRCPPDKVVQVLQAVHLLLAFPLFVVVVGVDARWVSHALEQHYPHLKREEEREDGEGEPFDFGRDATPHDYLEKIFQIPIWLHPIGERGSCQMLDGLLGDKVVDPEPEDAPVQGDAGPASTPPAGQRPEEGGPPAPIEPQGTGAGAPVQPAGEGGPASAEQPTVPLPEPVAEEPPIELRPKGLEILTSELAFMKELAGVVGRSPRAIKRFVNLYRLLKATLEQTEEPLSTCAPPPGEEGPPLCDYEIVLLLLAVVTGLPDVSRSFFDVIREGAAQNEAGLETARDLSWALERLRETATGIRGAEADLERLEAWLKGYREGAWLAAPLQRFEQRAGQAARYSFRVEQR